jgi:hypothetical protein
MRILPLLVVLLFISCANSSVENRFVFSFPKVLKEVSGIQKSLDSDLIYTIEDSGNENQIYGLDVNGEIKKSILIEDLENIDWEDLTADKKGNLYIGDFGNNNNTRKDLAIYQVSAASLDSTTTKSSYKVSFYYPEQTDFPPKKKEYFYDCESFFEYNNNFYLFTKNRSKRFDGTTLMYKVPNAPGNHKAVLMGKFKTCGTYSTCAITSAAFSPDAKKMVLLAHNQVWLFEDFTGDAFFDGKVTALDLDDYTQKEGLCFKDNATIYISDEKTKNIGGNLYQYNLDDLKSKP